MFQTIEEQQNDVWLAAQSYMKKEIEVNELKAIEKRHADTFGDALLALSKSKVQRDLVEKIFKVLRF